MIGTAELVSEILREVRPIVDHIRLHHGEHGIASLVGCFGDVAVGD